MKKKKELRKQILAKRKGLSESSVIGKSNIITTKLIELKSFKKANSVHLYYPINNEVDTRKIIEYLWEKKINVIMPRTDFNNHILVNYVVTNFDQLEKTKFNMLEPRESLEIFSGSPDLILVPGVAFDFDCNRMGYGGGFYDRFLSESTGCKIALSYDLQILEKLPTEDHDIKMDMIITENYLIKNPRLF